MKKSILLTAVLVACLIALSASAWSVLGRGLALGYDNAGKYTVGEAVVEGTVAKLDVHWVDGSVTLAFHEGDGIALAETSKKSLSDADRLRWWLDGDTLRVQYAKPGLRLKYDLDKALTISLPEGLKLEALDIEATSGDLIVPAMEVQALTLKTTSGEISSEASARTLTAEATSGDIGVTLAGADSVALSATSGDIDARLEDAQAVTLSATSGEIQLAQAGETQSLNIETTSGKIRADLDSVGDSAIETTSGGIELSAAKAVRTALATTSGRVEVQLDAFDALSVKATSGDVTAALPAEPGFTGEIKTTSGSFESAVALEKQDKVYRCGDGSGQLSIRTTSGDITLGRR